MVLQDLLVLKVLKVQLEHKDLKVIRVIREQ